MNHDQFLMLIKIASLQQHIKMKPKFPLKQQKPLDFRSMLLIPFDILSAWLLSELWFREVWLFTFTTCDWTLIFIK